MSSPASRAKRRRKNWILIVAVLALMGLVRWSIEPERTDPRELEFYQHTPNPLVIAHRGGAHLRPENTLVAFDYGLGLGADVLEMDVRSSADGHLMVIHDATVDRTTDGQGNVQALSLEHLQKLDAGYHFKDLDGASSWRGKGVRIPQLREVLSRFPTSRLYVEIKQGGDAGLLCDVLGADRADRVVVASFLHEEIEQFRQQCPGYLTAASTPETTWFVVYQFLGLAKLYSGPSSLLSLRKEKYGVDLVRKTLVQRARQWHISVDYWTLNERAEMQAAIASGARGIITDRPDLLLDELGRRIGRVEPEGR